MKRIRLATFIIGPMVMVLGSLLRLAGVNPSMGNWVIGIGLLGFVLGLIFCLCNEDD